MRIPQNRQAPCSSPPNSPSLQSGFPESSGLHLTLSCCLENSPSSSFLKVRGGAQPGRDLVAGWAMGAGWGGEMHVGGVWGALEAEWLQGSWQQQPAGSAPGPQGAEAEICFSVCSGSGRMVKRQRGQMLRIRQDGKERERAEQLGAKEATAVTEQSADWRKQVSCFFPSHMLLPIWDTGTRAQTHTHTEDTLREQAVSCFHPAVGRHDTDPNGISY